MPTTLLTPIPRIGNVIPINELTLFTGLPGSGKSYTLLKFLNVHKVKPILFNLDSDFALQQFDTYQFSDEYLPSVINQQVVDLKDQVIVIDTYIRLMDVMGMCENTTAQQQCIATMLEELAKKQQCTIIVVGHPEDYVGRSSIFKDNPYLVRNAAEHIHIDKVVSTKKNSSPEYRFYVNKGRGIGGTTIMDNFMRDSVINPLTNKTV